MMTAHLCEYTENCWIVHFKWFVYELYLSKVVIYLKSTCFRMIKSIKSNILSIAMPKSPSHLSILPQLKALASTGIIILKAHFQCWYFSVPKPSLPICHQVMLLLLQNIHWLCPLFTAPTAALLIQVTVLHLVCLRLEPTRKLRTSPATATPLPFLFICLFKGHVRWLVGSYFPDQGLNPGSQWWKCWVLTTGLPRNPLQLPFNTVTSMESEWSF